jgi:hypothetical protein
MELKPQILGMMLTFVQFFIESSCPLWPSRVAGGIYNVLAICTVQYDAATVAAAVKPLQMPSDRVTELSSLLDL